MHWRDKDYDFSTYLQHEYRASEHIVSCQSMYFDLDQVNVTFKFNTYLFWRDPPYSTSILVCNLYCMNALFDNVEKVFHKNLLVECVNVHKNSNVFIARNVNYIIYIWFHQYSYFMKKQL